MAPIWYKRHFIQCLTIQTGSFNAFVTYTYALSHSDSQDYKCMLVGSCHVTHRWHWWMAHYRYYSDAIWVLWRLRLPSALLFVQRYVGADIKENTKAPRYWPFVRWTIGDRCFPLQRGSNTESVSIAWRHHGEKAISCYLNQFCGTSCDIIEPISLFKIDCMP